jgi:hypothetical protein
MIVGDSLQATKRVSKIDKHQWTINFDISHVITHPAPSAVDHEHKKPQVVVQKKGYKQDSGSSKK